MEINCKISLLINSDGINIQLYDDDACVKFLELNLTLSQSMQALSRLAHTNVDNCNIRGLDKIGKKRESKELIVQMPYNWDYATRKDIAKERVEKECPEGWTPSLYFNSQNSFFSRNDGLRYVRTTIHRWVEI